MPYDVRSTAERQGRKMMWTDKAFGIWMGHAGEDTQVFTQDDAVVDPRAFERTQVLAIPRRDVTVADASVARHLRESEPERLAA
jgi:hypothetical protein